MSSRHYKASVCSLLFVLFLSSVTFSLWLGHIPLTPLQLRLGNAVMAQSPTTDRLVQQGVELYRAGDIQGAIAQWQIALSAYQKTNKLHLCQDSITFPIAENYIWKRIRNRTCPSCSLLPFPINV